MNPKAVPEALRRGLRAIQRTLRPLLLLTVALAGVGQAPGARAHELSLARFELSPANSATASASDRRTYRLLVLLPDAGGLDGPRRPGWPENCEVEDTLEVFQGGGTRLEFIFSCTTGLASDAVLTTPWGQDGAVFTTHFGGRNADGTAQPRTLVLAGRRAGVDIPLGQGETTPRSLLTTARDFAGLGMFHILEGWDHLAFVLCLCLLVSGRGLLLLVTAFTVGHSASLALAYLGYISVPMRPVEAVIALSVAFMAREAILQPQSAMPRNGVGLRHGAVVTGFGLLHGLGFASELEGLGISAGERITGLLTFNLGVEIGQLLFVALTLFLLSAARLLAWQRQARLAALAGAGVLGMYWFTERIIALF